MARKMWAIVLVLVLLATSGLAGCAKEAEWDLRIILPDLLCSVR